MKVRYTRKRRIDIGNAELMEVKKNDEDDGNARVNELGREK